VFCARLEFCCGLAHWKKTFCHYVPEGDINVGCEDFRWMNICGKFRGELKKMSALITGAGTDDPDDA
jgi:hypothetical protein